MFKRKSDIYNFIIIILTVIIVIVTYNKLPDRVPIHWNINGEANGYGPKYVMAILIPGLMILTWVGMRFLPKIDPKKENYKKFESSYSVIISLFITYFFIMYVITTAITFGYNIPVDKVVCGMMGILFLVMGNYLPKSKSNFFYGIKTPWTLSSEVSWNKTHRLGGKLFVLAGLLVILGAIFLKGQLLLVVVIASTSTAGIVPIVASYFYSKK